MAKDNWLPLGRRVLDVAYLRDGDITHTGEALALAMLIHTSGTSNRSWDEIQHVAKMMNDPNVDKPKARRYSNKKKR